MHSWFLLVQVLSELIPASSAKGPVPSTQPPANQSKEFVVPKVAKADGTFRNDRPQLTVGYPETTIKEIPVPDIYNARDIDIPFGRLFHGSMSMFPKGQLNDPTKNTDDYQTGVDSANQSATGIPDNAYFQGKAAIHPYFLKYAGLARWAMPDVCLSIWAEGDHPDMLIKVTDICSIDEKDPTHCPTPGEFKIDRTKVEILYELGIGSKDPRLQGDVWPEKVWWHFAKCWTNALTQPAYFDNWFAQPVLPNVKPDGKRWDTNQTSQQFKNNQISYPKRGWPIYPHGWEIPTPEMKKNSVVPFDDWVKGQEPSWKPIAGGKGFGTPELSKGPPVAEDFGMIGANNVVGGDVCGNGGCKNQMDRCNHLKQNGQPLPADCPKQ